LKQHLAHRGAEVVHCRNVPPDVRDYFQRDIENARKATAERARDYFPAAVLNPRYSYTMDPTQEMFRGLKDTFERMTDVQSAVQALQELEVFRQKVGEFGSEMAMRMAMDPKTSPCKSYSVTYCCFLYI